MAEDWNNTEIDLILTDYFAMLSKELTGIAYSKTEHRHAIIPLLNNRSAGSVEFKHQNISAVLAKLGQPFIRGYKPRYNYQRTLEDKILDHLIGNDALDRQFKQFSERDVNTNIQKVDLDSVLVEAPKIESTFQDDKVDYIRRGVKTNYLLKEQNNSKLGISGERFAFEFEKWQLFKIGKEKLADQVEWVSQSQGDGLGFDILSKNIDGSDKFIEVKTTKLSRQSPFFFSKNEMTFSIEQNQRFHLYRVFEFDKAPKLFTLNGSLKTICRYDTELYKGYF